MPQFHIATADGASREVQGVAAWLYVGPQRRKFILHDGTLSDFRSGRRFGDYGTRQAMHYASDPYRSRLTPRAAAQQLIDYTIDRIGLDRVLTVLENAPALKVAA